MGNGLTSPGSKDNFHSTFEDMNSNSSWEDVENFFVKSIGEKFISPGFEFASLPDDDISSTPTTSNTTRKSRRHGKALYMPVPRRSYLIDASPYPAVKTKQLNLTFTVDGNTKRVLRFIKQLGKGGVGDVFLVEDITVNREGEAPQKMALKRVHDEQNKILLIRESVQLIRKFARECGLVAEIFEDYLLPAPTVMEKSELYIVLKYYEHGSLDSLFTKEERISEKGIKQIMHDLFYPLGVLHSQGILHRDISLDNILIKQICRNKTLRTVLNDFDIAREKEFQMTMGAGKLFYRAPEVFHGMYDTSADIWSAGIVLYQLMTLEKLSTAILLNEPKQDEEHEVMRQKMKQHKLYSDELIELVLSMLRYNPAERPTAIKVYSTVAENNGELLAYGYKTKSMEIIQSTTRHNIFHACKSGDEAFVQHAINQGANDWNSGLWGACKGGSLYLARMMIEKGADDWNIALFGACDGGHLELVNYIIERHNVKNWNKGLQGACNGGHIDIMNLMIKKGAKDWQSGLDYACVGGHVDVAQMMIDRGAEDFNHGMWYACINGHMDVLQLMIDKGANNWNLALRGACRSGNSDIIAMLCQMGADDWNAGLTGACEGKKYDIIELMLELGATDMNSGLKGACAGGHKRIIKMMIEKGANDWNGAMYQACSSDRIEVVEYLIRKGANDWNGGLVAACKNSNTRTIRNMLLRGADATILTTRFPHIKV